MSQPNIAYINFLADGSLPQVFNPATFKLNSIQSDALSTQNLTVTSQAVTNGIADYASIDAKRLTVDNEAFFTGSLVPNSTCLATTYYVDDKINQIMGGGNINTLLDTISEINTALNSDPNFADTVGLRIGQVEVNTQNNANNITQLDASIDTINETLLDLDSRLVLDRTDIDDMTATLQALQTGITENTAKLALHTVDISANTANIETLTLDVSANTAGIEALALDVSANTASIQTNTLNIASNSATIATNASNIATNSTNIATNSTNIATLQTAVASHATELDTLDAGLTSVNTVVSGHATSIADIGTSITTIQTTLDTKANKSNPTFTGTATFATISTQSLTDNGNITIKGNTAIGDQSTDTLTVTGNAKFNHNVVLSDNSNVLTRFGTTDTAISGINTSIGTINSTLATKANDSEVVHNSGNEFISGIKTFNGGLKLGVNDVATTYDIQVAINNLINSAPSTLDTLGELATQLQQDQNSISTILNSMVTMAGAQTITGAKTFQTSPSVPTLAQGNNSTSVASTAYVDTGLSTKANASNPTFTGTATFATIATQSLTDNGNVTIKGNTAIGDQPTDTLTVTGNATFNHNVTIDGQNVATRFGNIESNYLTTASATSTYLKQTDASTTYQAKADMSNYVQSTLYSSANTWTGANEYKSDIVTSKMVEKYVAGTVTSNAMSINYASNTNNIYSISPSSANNIALTISNLPTNRGTAIYDFTFLINTATNKNYIATLNVNGSAITMKAMGGLANVSVNASATLVIQTIHIQMNGASVSNAITSVASCF